MTRRGTALPARAAGARAGRPPGRSRAAGPRPGRAPRLGQLGGSACGLAPERARRGWAAEAPGSPSSPQPQPPRTRAAALALAAGHIGRVRGRRLRGWRGPRPGRSGGARRRGCRAITPPPPPRRPIRSPGYNTRGEHAAGRRGARGPARTAEGGTTGTPDGAPSRPPAGLRRRGGHCGAWPRRRSCQCARPHRCPSGGGAAGLPTRTAGRDGVAPHPPLRAGPHPTQRRHPPRGGRARRPDRAAGAPAARRAGRVGHSPAQAAGRWRSPAAAAVIPAVGCIVGGARGARACRRRRLPASPSRPPPWPQA